jgi:hypothetical protein
MSVLIHSWDGVDYYAWVFEEGEWTEISMAF